MDDKAANLPNYGKPFNDILGGVYAMVCTYAFRLSISRTNRSLGMDGFDNQDLELSSRLYPC